MLYIFILFVLSVILGLPEASINEFSYGVFNISGITIYLTDILVAIIVTSSIISCCFTGKIKYSNLFYPIIMFLAVQTIPVFIGIYTNNLIDIIGDFRGAIYVLVIWSWAQLVDNKIKYQSIVRLTIVYASLIFSLIIIYLYVFSIQHLYFIDNRISYKTLSLLVVAFYICCDEIFKKPRPLFLVVLMLSVTMNILGGFRVLLFYQIVGATVIYLKHRGVGLSKGNINTSVRVFIFLLLIVATATFAPINQMINELTLRTFLFIQSPQSDYSFVTRLNDINSTLDTLQSNMYFGSGYGRKILLSTSGGNNLFVDNLYFTLLSKVGIFGFLLFIVILLGVFKQLVSFHKDHIVSGVTIVILILVGSNFGASVWYDHTLPLAIAMLLSESFLNRRNFHFQMASINHLSSAKLTESKDYEVNKIKIFDIRNVK